MSKLSPRLERITQWLLLYLWSVPLVAVLADLMGWQYDGAISAPLWWLAAGYTLPVGLLAEVTNDLEDGIQLAGYFLILGLASGMFLYFRSRRSTRP